METLKDLLLSIADDFREPDAAVHGHEEGAATKAHRLGVRGDIRINEPVPHLQDLDLAAAFLQAQSLKDL